MYVSEGPECPATNTLLELNVTTVLHTIVLQEGADKLLSWQVVLYVWDLNVLSVHVVSAQLQHQGFHMWLNLLLADLLHHLRQPDTENIDK